MIQKGRADPASAQSLGILGSYPAGEICALLSRPAFQPAMQKSAVINVPTAGGIHQSCSGIRWLMKSMTTRQCDMAAVNAIRDDQDLCGGSEQLFKQMIQVITATKTAGKFPREDSHLTLQNQIPDGIPITPRTTVERNKHALSLRCLDGFPRRVLMAAIDMQESRFLNKLQVRRIQF